MGKNRIVACVIAFVVCFVLCACDSQKGNTDHSIRLNRAKAYQDTIHYTGGGYYVRGEECLLFFNCTYPDETLIDARKLSAQYTLDNNDPVNLNYKTHIYVNGIIIENVDYICKNSIITLTLDFSQKEFEEHKKLKIEINYYTSDHTNEVTLATKTYSLNALLVEIKNIVEDNREDKSTKSIFV